MSVAKPVHSPDGTAQPAASRAALARSLRGRSLALSQRWTWRLTALAVLLLAGLLIGALVYGFLRTAARITVTVDGMPATVYTHQATVGDLLAEMQISLRPEDRLLVAADTLLQPGLAIEIQRARPVLVDDGGRVRTLYTHAALLQDMLAERGMVVGSHDLVSIDGQWAAAAAPLPLRVVDGGRNLPGVPAVYPWRGTQIEPVAVELRRAVPLTVQVGSLEWATWSTASTVGEALASLGLVFYEGDRVEPGLGTPLLTDQRVVIQRSKPVTIATANHALHTRSLGATVADLMAENGLLLTGLDRVEPALDTPLAADMAVRITRVQHVFEVEEQVTPYESIWEADPELEIDNQRLEQEGVNGITRQRYRVILEDSQPITRTLDDTWLAQAPVTRVNKYGSQIVLRELATPNGPLTYWRKVRMFATSYTAADAGTPREAAWYGLTRTGMRAGYGVVAVDPSVVRLYTQLYVPGYGQAVAGDTGGGVKGRWIDLGFEVGQAVPWSRCVDVYLLGPPPPSYQITYRLPNTPSVACLRR
jgi:uncharacterized protein YabE (DUF348 family)